MSERKVLNKYYPPDFDPSKLPRVKREKNRQFTIRLMAPFNMRCKTCGEYIYRGKKFNARKEDVLGSTYLGIQIYRFYIKCTKCLAEITFKTDPENQDYEMENGAIRNFESVRLAEKQAELEAKQKKEEEVNNPMKILENRTRESRRDMDIIDALEDIRDQNAANINVDPKILLHAEEEYRVQLERLQREEDEEEIRRLFKKNVDGTSCILDTNNDDNSEEDEEDEDEKEVGTKKKSLEENEDDEYHADKKLKTEPTTTKSSALSGFLKSKIQPNNRSESSKLNLQKKNIDLFVKKKTVATTENNENQSKLPQPATEKPAAALSSILNAYGSSDSD